jgi:hypothetical protein
MTTETYVTIMKDLQRLTAEVQPSPEAARKMLIEGGLGDLVDDPAAMQIIRKVLRPYRDLPDPELPDLD